MRAFGYLVAALALALPGVGLADSGSSRPPIEIAAIYNTTGAQSALDTASLLGARLAIAEASRSGGFSGRPFELVVGEGNSDPRDLAKVTEALIAAHPETVAFIGLSDTDMLLAAAPPVIRSGRAFVTSGATSPELPAQVPGGFPLAVSAITFRPRRPPNGHTKAAELAPPRYCRTDQCPTPGCSAGISRGGSGNWVAGSFRPKAMTAAH